MTSPVQWRRGLRPDDEVIKLIEKTNSAAHKGHVRVIGIATVDPMLEIEILHAGTLDRVRAHMLAAAHMKAAQKLLSQFPE